MGKRYQAKTGAATKNNSKYNILCINTERLRYFCNIQSCSIGYAAEGTGCDAPEENLRRAGGTLATGWRNACDVMERPSRRGGVMVLTRCRNDFDRVESDMRGVRIRDATRGSKTFDAVSGMNS